MPAVTRELSVVYGAITLGGSSDTELLHAVVSVDEDANRGTLTCEFVMRAATEAAFAARIAALEPALRDPRQRLRMIQGAQTLHDFNPATNSGFNQQPILRKPGNRQFDSGRSRFYVFSVDFDLPANVYDQSGRRNAREVIDYTPARRRNLTLSGEWTVVTGGSTSATTQYTGNVAAYASTVTSGLGGTWEKVDEEINRDETDKVIQFRQVWEELTFDQSSGVRDHGTIVQSTLSVTKGVTAPGDSPGGGAQRLIEIRVAYDAWIDTGVSTDLASVYKSTIRPWLIAHAIERSQVGSAALVGESPTFEGKENRISVSMTLLGAPGGSVLEYRETLEVNDADMGNVFVPAWTGNPFGGYLYSGPRLRFRTKTIQRRSLIGGAGGGGGGGFGGINRAGATLGQISGFAAAFGIDRPGVGRFQFGQVEGDMIATMGGGRGVAGRGGGGGWTPPGWGGASWVPVSHSHQGTPLRLGTSDKPLDVVDETIVSVDRWFEQFAEAGPGQILSNRAEVVDP